MCYYLLYCTHHRRLSVFIQLPAFLRDKTNTCVLVPRSPLNLPPSIVQGPGNSHGPHLKVRVCGCPCFLSQETSFTQLKESQKTSPPSFLQGRIPGSVPCYFTLHRHCFWRWPECYCLLSKLFFLNQLSDCILRKCSRQEEEWRGLMVIAVFWEVSSSLDCVWSENK